MKEKIGKILARYLWEYCDRPEGEVVGKLCKEIWEVLKRVK